MSELNSPSGVGATSFERRLGLALTVLAAVLYPVFLWRGWGCWNDVLVDFGRELYVPWRLTEGEVLYRDVAYFNGPLSPYWNALVFRVGGVSLQTLTIANVFLTAIFAWLLHRRVEGAGGPIAAGAGLVAFLAIFACGHFPGVGNYNFLAPYSHELTHGLILGLLAYGAALRASRAGGVRQAALTGILIGLVFLTKAEVFVGTAGAIGWLFVLRWKTERANAPRRIALVAGGALLVPLIACGLLMGAMPFADALRGTLGSWVGIFGSKASELPFYRMYMGLDRPGDNLGVMFTGLGYLLAFLVPAFAIDRYCSRRSLKVRAALGALFAVIATALMAWQERTPPDWLNVARFLPLVALAAVGFASLRALRGDPGDRERWSERAAFALFGLLMMAKIILMVMLAHYGFALALLGALVFVVVTLEWLPALAGGASCRGVTLRLTALGLIGTTALGYWRMSEEMFSAMTITVGAGPDAFRAEPPRGTGVAALLSEIDTRMAPSQDLLVLPEGIMVNFLARRRTPTRHINFMPPEIELFGEEEILQELRTHPAAALALIHKDTSEYGAPLFGTHYGQKMMRWARRNYQADWLWGQPPLEPGSYFGIGFMGPR